MCGDGWENVVSILVSCWGLRAVLHRASVCTAHTAGKEETSMLLLSLRSWQSGILKHLQVLEHRLR